MQQLLPKERVKVHYRKLGEYALAQLAEELRGSSLDYELHYDTVTHDGFVEVPENEQYEVRQAIIQWCELDDSK